MTILSEIFRFSAWPEGRKIRGEPPIGTNAEILFSKKMKTESLRLEWIEGEGRGGEAARVIGNLKADIPGWHRSIYLWKNAAKREVLTIVKVRREQQKKQGPRETR